MPDSEQPNKETVHLELPPDIVAKPPAINLKQREKVRIQLPPRPPSDKWPMHPPGPPPISVVSSSSAMPAPVPLDHEIEPAALEQKQETARIGVVPELKRETARIPVVPEPSSRRLPALQMKKSQPLVTMPEAAARRASISVAPIEESTMIDLIPMPLCWTLLGVSAIVLIIQIWIYFS